MQRGLHCVCWPGSRMFMVTLRCGKIQHATRLIRLPTIHSKVKVTSHTTVRMRMFIMALDNGDLPMGCGAWFLSETCVFEITFLLPYCAQWCVKDPDILFPIKFVRISQWLRGWWRCGGWCAAQDVDDQELLLRLILDDPLGGEDPNSEQPAWYNLDPTSNLRIRCESPRQVPMQVMRFFWDHLLVH